MNFVMYYLNSAGYPQFCFVCEDCKSDAVMQFKHFHPDADLKNVFVSVDDMKNYLIGGLK